MEVKISTLQFDSNFNYLRCLKYFTELYGKAVLLFLQNCNTTRTVFTKNRSRTTVVDSIAKNKKSIAIIQDKKAFDMVSHETLLTKHWNKKLYLKLV